MAKRARVVVVGSINMDLVVSSPRIPMAGETLLGDSFRTFPGGKGANQAVAAARMGACVHMIGCLGNDTFGKQLYDLLIQEKIGLEHVDVLDGLPSGVAAITVSRGGENTIVVAPGANGHLNPERIRKAAPIIREADILLVQLEIPLDAVWEAVEMAKAHQVRVILNPAPAVPLEEKLLHQVDFLTPNMPEAKLLSGFHADKDVPPEFLISSLLEKGVKHVVMTRGSEGVLVNDQNTIISLPAYRVHAVDTTAAGDCFNGTLGVYLAEGYSLLEAIDWAQKAASLSVSRYGAQPSLPYREEVESFGGQTKT